MKKITNSMIAFLAIGVLACNAPQKTKSTSETSTSNAEAVVYTVNTENSTLEWYGDKLLGEGHHGTINLMAGTLEIADGNLVGGEFSVDMTTMANTDLPTEEKKAKLIGHLSNGDFFEVEKYPTAQLVITSVDGSTINADLTIKDKTNQISFPYTLTWQEDDSYNATAGLAFDRTKFGVVYGSGSVIENLAKDKIINDKIKLQLALSAAK
ncbi:MAG: YceI family protein [Cyclobacteriaceae bacterium]